VYWLKSPVALLVLAILGGAALGATVAVQGWLICAAAFSMLGVGALWPWLGMRGIRAELRMADDRCEEGENATSEIVLMNHWPWPIWGLKLSHGFAEIQETEDEPDFALAGVPGWSTGVYRWDFVPYVRGVYPRESIKISTSFPFGLYEVSIPVEIKSQLLVRPRSMIIVPDDAPPGRRWSLSTHDEFSTGREGDVLGTRPFQRGDGLRDVHWSLSARYGNWIVRERQSNCKHRSKTVARVG
jgi:uncharacterized protein (DUF58 family)